MHLQSPPTSLSFEYCIVGLCNSPGLSYPAVIPFLYIRTRRFLYQYPLNIIPHFYENHHSFYVLPPSIPSVPDAL